MKPLILFPFFILFFTFGCQKETITISNQAADVFFLENQGATMPIRVHGNTASKVFLMMIHGGPGGDAMVYRTDYVIDNLESDLAMVYWDQRSSGASQGGANKKFGDLSHFIEDFEKVITLLKHRYGADISIFVNGHSWGGFLTPAFLQKDNNQYTVKGWIQTAGAHNIDLVNRYSVEKLIDKATVEIAAERNVGDWTEIRDYCQALTFPISIEEGRQVNIYAGKAQGLTKEIPDLDYSFRNILESYVENDFPLLQVFFPTNPVTNSLADWLFQGQQVSDNMNKITIPTLLLFGKWDFICPEKLADDIEMRIQSAYKKKVIFENSGHGIMAGADEVAYWDEIQAFINEFK